MVEKDAPQLFLEIHEFDLKRRGTNSNGGSGMMMADASCYSPPKTGNSGDMLMSDDHHHGGGVSGTYYHHVAHPQPCYAPGVPRGPYNPMMR